MAPSTAMTGGLNKMAPNGVPVGCELEPVTDGILMALSTKLNAPAAPSNMAVSGFSLICFCTLYAP